jgi:quinol monooxygenase YgiN
MTQRATTALSLHYHIRPGQREAVLVEIKGILDRCAQEPEFITGIVHETPERPNEFVFYELWKGTRADFDAIQAETISEGLHGERQAISRKSGG